ncbi:hypothetical protein [Pseudanabaena sp. PCC 6802]|nr:hypothetical protein [Pseudanabaena sp. PCC 6802]
MPTSSTFIVKRSMQESSDRHAFKNNGKRSLFRETARAIALVRNM